MQSRKAAKLVKGSEAQLILGDGAKHLNQSLAEEIGLGVRVLGDYSKQLRMGWAWVPAPGILESQWAEVVIWSNLEPN
jgi:hypothetical protein